MCLNVTKVTYTLSVWMRREGCKSGGIWWPGMRTCCINHINSLIFFNVPVKQLESFLCIMAITCKSVSRSYSSLLPQHQDVSSLSSVWIHSITQSIAFTLLISLSTTIQCLITSLPSLPILSILPSLCLSFHPLLLFFPLEQKQSFSLASYPHSFNCSLFISCIGSECRSPHSLSPSLCLSLFHSPPLSLSLILETVVCMQPQI